MVEPNTEADAPGLLLQFLAFAGNSIGPGPFFATGPDRQTTNLYLVLVGLSAKARKGTSLGLVRRMFGVADSEWEKDHILAGLSSGEGLINAVRDPIEREEPVKEKGRVVEYQTVRVDPGVADKRALMIESEFASTLKVMAREGNTLSGVLRQAWDSGHLRTLTKNSPVRATGAHVSMIAHVTEPELRKTFNETEQANGFGNRILWGCVRRSKLLPEGGRLERQSIERLGLSLRTALEFARFQGEVGRSDDARAFWEEIYTELSQERPGLFGAITARAEAQVRRLALIYALLDRASVIGVSHLRAALAVWAYAFESAFFIFGSATGDSVADAILRKLRETPAGLTRTAISSAFSHHRSKLEIDAALEVLLESGRAAFESVKSIKGRPKQVWTALR